MMTTTIKLAVRFDGATFRATENTSGLDDQVRDAIMSIEFGRTREQVSRTVRALNTELAADGYNVVVTSWEA